MGTWLACPGEDGSSYSMSNSTIFTKLNLGTEKNFTDILGKTSITYEDSAVHRGYFSSQKHRANEWESLGLLVLCSSHHTAVLPRHG